MVEWAFEHYGLVLFMAMGTLMGAGILIAATIGVVTDYLKRR